MSTEDYHTDIQKIIQNIDEHINDYTKNVKPELQLSSVDMYYSLYLYYIILYSPMHTEFNQEAHNIIKNWLKVEAESEQIKDKVTHSKKATNSGIASEVIRPRTGKQLYKKPKEENPEDDMKIAFE